MTPRAIVRVLPPASSFSESAAPATVTPSVRPTSRLDMLAEYNLYNNRREVSMNDDRTRVLLILSREILDKARVIAGKATIALKLPVSLQIVLRALLEEGLKRDGQPVFLARVESQARAVRDRRVMARRAVAGARTNSRPGHSGRR